MCFTIRPQVARDQELPEQAKETSTHPQMFSCTSPKRAATAMSTESPVRPDNHLKAPGPMEEARLSAKVLCVYIHINRNVPLPSE